MDSRRGRGAEPGNARGAVARARRRRTLAIALADPRSGLRSLARRARGRRERAARCSTEEYPGNLISGGPRIEHGASSNLDPKALGKPSDRARVRITARDWSWREWLSGNAAQRELPLTIDLDPPRSRSRPGSPMRSGAAPAPSRIGSPSRPQRTACAWASASIAASRARAAARASASRSSPCRRHAPGARRRRSSRATPPATSRPRAGRWSCRSVQQPRRSVTLPRRFFDNVLPRLAGGAHAATRPRASTTSTRACAPRTRRASASCWRIRRAEPLFDGALQQLANSQVTSRFAEQRTYFVDGAAGLEGRALRLRPRLHRRRADHRRRGGARASTRAISASTATASCSTTASASRRSTAICRASTSRPATQVDAGPDARPLGLDRARRRRSLALRGARRRHLRRSGRVVGREVGRDAHPRPLAGAAEARQRRLTAAAARAEGPLRDAGALRARLLAWYRADRRDLPWRRTRDPYAIWISESMLQQTRVETVIPYYERFLARFPDVASLARADLDDVLALWTGLGYYSRARNLHRAARELVRAARGRAARRPGARCARCPASGRYTAGAVASIAFDRPEPIVDGNVARVLARLLGIRRRRRRRRGHAPALWQEAAALAARPEPGDAEPGADGARRDGLHAARAALRRVSGGARLRRAARGRRRGAAAQGAPRPRARAVEAVAGAGVARRGRVLAVRRPRAGAARRPVGAARRRARGRASAPRDAIARALRERVGLRLADARPLGARRARLHAPAAAPARVPLRGSPRDACALRGSSAHRWLAPTALRALPQGGPTRKALALAFPERA